MSGSGSGSNEASSSSLPRHLLESIGANPSNSNSSPELPPTADEFLRRLSHPDNVDLRIAHDTLGLSGNIISATFCVPYKIGYSAEEGEWVSCPPDPPSSPPP
jgi:trehalose 6-phosphate synthase/phosphatase